MTAVLTDGAWIGNWLLLPELGDYGNGTAPQRATYDIDVCDIDTLGFKIAWWNNDTQTSVAFEGIPDGVERPTDTPGVTKMSIVAHDRLRLDSAAWAEDRMVARARRRVSEDGTLMSIVQEIFPRDKTEPVAIFQVYMRRVDD